MIFALAIYLLLGLFAVVYLPQVIAPDTSLENKDGRDAVDISNKVRQTIVQIVGGAGFLFTILLAIESQRSANLDLQRKFEKETAETFIKAVESKSPEALYVLSGIATRDQSYRALIVQILAGIVQITSQDSCANERYSKPDYAVASKTMVALQILGDRKGPFSNNLPNLERACLVGVNLNVPRQSWGSLGFPGALMSQAKLLRVDFSRLELQKTVLMGIDAGDWRNPGWSEEVGKKTLFEQPDYVRQKYVANFSDTNLTGARLDGAGLEGADFRGAVMKDAVLAGANISRTNFQGAQGLTVEQLRTACVGSSDPATRSTEQPKIADELKVGDGVPLCK